MRNLLVIVIALALLAGCTPVHEGPAIGALLPLSGQFNAFGEQLRQGIESANTSVPIIFEDSKCDPVASITGFRKLADVDEVQYVIGPGCGAPQEAVAPLAKDKDVIIMLPSAASGNLHEISGGKVFQMQYALQDESRFIADEFDKRGYERALLVSYQNAFSKTHADSFKEHYDGEIVKELVFSDSSDNTYAQLAQVTNLEFDAVFVNDMIFFVSNGNARFGELGIDVPIFTHYGAEIPMFREMVEGVTYTFPSIVPFGEDASKAFAREAAVILDKAISDCRGDFDCVHQRLLDSDRFDERGIGRMEIELRQIVDGEVVLLDE